MKDLSNLAKIFVLSTILAGGLLISWQLGQIEWLWNWLIPLAAMAGFAQIYKVEGSTHQSSFNLSWLIYGFTFILLGVPEALFVIIASHLVEWLWYRYRWYIQLFNISNYSIAITAAGLVQSGIQLLPANALVAEALSLLGAIAAFTLVNHLLVGTALLVARGQSFRESGIFKWLTLLIEFSMIGTGVVGAFVWTANPFAVFLTLLPVYLIYNTLKIPSLQRQSEIDPKTGLYNARHFAMLLEKELARAQKFDRPLTLVMGDLDLLRNINNTYGHLAGDVVLIGVANILKEVTGEYDVVARFGGEEFSIMLPETTKDEAYPLVEKIRMSVETADFVVTTNPTPIKATISFGITQRNGETQGIRELIHNADVSLYYSKMNGRNLTSVDPDPGESDFLRDPIQFPTAMDPDSFQTRIEHSISRFRPNPFREPVRSQVVPLPPVAAEKPPEAEAAKPQRKSASAEHVFLTLLGMISIAVVALAAAAWEIPVDWAALIFFSLAVIVVEAVQIDIHVDRVAVPVAIFILITGVLLFGPLAAYLLSAVLVVTSKLVRDLTNRRAIFEMGTTLLSSGIIALLLGLTQPASLTELPLTQVLGLSILAAYLLFFIRMSLGAIYGKLKTNLERFWAVSTPDRRLFVIFLVFGILVGALIQIYAEMYVLGVSLALIPVIFVRLSQNPYLRETKVRLTTLNTKTLELQKQYQESESFKSDLLQAVAELTDIREPISTDHTRGVAYFAVRIAEEMGLPQAHIKLTETAAILHDVGKIGVPDRLLFKDGELTEEEFEQVKEHSQLGGRILENIPNFAEIGPIVRHHHERFDGTGYPDGLSGDKIPLSARILHLADSLEAMASDRPFRTARPPEEIIAEVRRSAGTQFDPIVVAALVKIVDREGVQFFRFRSSNNRS